MSKFIRISIGLTVLLFLSSLQTAVAEDFLSVKYSKKNQLRTGMTWIKFKPKLILASELKKKRKPRAYREARRTKDAGRSAKFVASDDLLAKLPFSSVGKLFFTKDNDQVASCSAAFAGGTDVIVTAAHCVMTNAGDWNGDFLFIRSYGSSHQDVYAIQCVAVPSEWGEITGDEILPHDYAFLRTNRQSKGGALDVTNNAPPRELTIVGYSDNHSNGRKLLQLKTQILSAVADRLGSLKNPLGVGNSGAPWIGQSKVFSVSSHYLTDEKGIMWGPRLTQNTMGLIKYAKNGCESSSNGHEAQMEMKNG